MKNVIPFFVLLFGMLFLGDGKSSVVDIVGAAVVVVISVLALTKSRSARAFPLRLLWPWGALLGYLVISVPFSVDVGASIRAVVRFIDAFLVYYMFYVHIPDPDDAFVRSLLWFGAGALIASVIVAFVPTAKEALPSMSLLWSNAGHNHITDVWLLLLFPVFFALHKRPPLRYLILLFIILIFVWSQARAALAVVVLSIAGFVMRADSSSLFGGRGRKLLLVAVVAALIITVLLPEALRTRPATPSGAIRRKNPLSQERRAEYWGQAIAAIQKRPIFGFGPGTFPFLSNRYQSKPSNASWFAHNYVLEMASETGLIGTTLFLWVLYASYVRPTVYLLKQKTISWQREALLYAPLPLWLYGLVDFSLNYFVVWILLWATIGIATRHET